MTCSLRRRRAEVGVPRWGGEEEDIFLLRGEESQSLVIQFYINIWIVLPRVGFVIGILRDTVDAERGEKDLEGEIS